MFPNTDTPGSLFPLKDSIQDVARLHQFYEPSDEMLWAFFNVRVLLNQPIAVDDFIQQMVVAGEPYGQFSVPAVG